jgi:xanthine dehydrogenase accessory factor
MDVGVKNMLNIYAELVRTLAAREKSVLARIIRQTGSAPRRVGAALLVKADGSLVGTVGGGRLEHDVLRKAQEVLAGGRCAVLEVRLAGREVEAGEMLCGGSVDVLLEPVFPTDAGAESVFQEVVAIIREGRRGTLVTAVADGREGGDRFLVLEDRTVIGDACGVLGAAGVDVTRWAGVQRPAVEALTECEGRPSVFLEPVEAEIMLLLFGAGHISTFVAPLAHMVGFRVCVIDDRKEFANRRRFPTADQLMVCPVAEAFSRIALSPRTFIAIVTRGHAYDREALAAALAARPAYIGMIGSRRKRDLIYASLMEEGIAAEDLRRVHSPIGVSIGAETPEEIAVSIVAELIQVRAQLHEGRRPAPGVF